MKFSASPSVYGVSVHSKFFAGWPNPPSWEVVQQHFAATNCIFLIDDADEVIGFITAFTDGALAAFISLLEVREDYRGKGLGRQLVNEMLKKLKDVYAIDLVCDQELEDFYIPLGFMKGTAMIQRSRQALYE